MDIFLIFCILILFLYLPGYLALVYFFSLKEEKDKPDFLERQFFYIIISFVISSLILIILAGFSSFKAEYIFGILFFYIFLAIIFNFIFGFRPQITKIFLLIKNNISAELFLVLVLIVISCVLYLKPFEWIYGWRDPGIYVNTAVHIAQTGKIIIEDPLNVRLPHEFVQWPIPGLRYPGFYIYEKSIGIIYPQFFHLYTLWLALFYLVFGLKEALTLNIIFGILGLLSVYMFVRRSFNKSMAFIVYILLGLNAIQLYFSRYPTTEAMTQFLIFASIFILTVYFNFRRKIYMFLAGATFGLVFVLRIDAMFLLPSLYIVFLYIYVFKRDVYKIWPFLISFIAMMIISYVQTRFFAKRYTNDVFHILTHGHPELLLYAGIAGLIFFILIGQLSPLIKKTSSRFLSFEKPLRLFLSLIVILLGIYGYFIRPYIKFSIPVIENSWSKGILVYLGWYISGLGIILAFIGLAFFLYKEYDLDKITLASISLIPMVVYFLDPLISKELIFALRRFLPIIIPSLIIYISYILYFMLISWKKNQAADMRWRYLFLIGLVFSIYLLFFNIKTVSPYVPYIEYKGAIEDINEINQSFDKISSKDRIILIEPTSIVLAGWFAAPLNFLYQENNVFVYDHVDLQSMMNQIDNTGISNEKEIFILSNNNYHSDIIKKLKIKKIDSHLSKMISLEETRNHPPKKIVSDKNNFNIYYLDNKKL